MTTATNLFQGPGMHAIIHALGWTLLHFIWQGTLVAVVLWCVLALIDRRWADVRYAAACIAFSTTVLLPAVTFARLAANAYRAAYVHASVVDGGVFAIWVGPDAGPVSWAWLTTRLDASMPWLMLAWCVGVLGFSCRLAMGMVAARALKFRHTEVVSERFQQAFRSVRERLGIRRAVQVLYSARVHVPTVIGWLKPVILIPAECLTGLSDLQIEALLAHELAHVRRNDYLVSMLQSVVETVLFYHPGVWWVSRVLRREREYCCDDVAARFCGNRVAYARALSLLEEQRAMLPEMALGANGGVLTMRIKRLLGYREEIVFSNVVWVVVFAIAVGAGASIVGRLAFAESKAGNVPKGPNIQLAGQQLAAAGELSAVQDSASTQRSDARVRGSGDVGRELEHVQQEIAKQAASPDLPEADRKQLQQAETILHEALSKLQRDELKQHLGELDRKLNSEELRKQIDQAMQAASRVDSENIRKQMKQAQERLENSCKLQEQVQHELNGAEIKQRMADAQMQIQKRNSPEIRRQMEDAQKQMQRLNSENMKRQMEDARRQAEKFNSPEFREQMRKAVDDAMAANRRVLAQNDEAATTPPPPPSGATPSGAYGPVRISSGIAAQMAISQPHPVYPPEAKAAGIQGTVVLKAIIGKDGSVENLTVISGPPELMKSALDAVSQWKYKPYLLNGEPVEVQTTINVNYTLGDSGAGTSPSPQLNYAPVPPRMPAIIYKVEPQYTVEAKAAHIQGTVVVNATVNQQGIPEAVRVIKGLDPGLDQQAIAAVSQYRFKPAFENGQAVAQAVNVEVQYKLY